MIEPKVQDELAYIMDCFTGVDGGISYVKLRTFLEQLETQYTDGDYSAGKVLDIVSHFKKLIEIAQNDVKRKQE